MNRKTAAALGLVTFAVASRTAQTESFTEIAKRFCISGDCPTPQDLAGEWARIVVGPEPSSNHSVTWQSTGSTRANVGT